MSVTSFQFAEDDRYRAQIDKIIHSHSFRKSESLCRLLIYLADHTLTHPGVSLKEYQIATELFGRPHTFDPQTDAAIRVQAGRLRQKLAEYYSHEGASDPIILEMPNGVYALTLHERTAAPPGALEPAGDTHPIPMPSHGDSPARATLVPRWIDPARRRLKITAIVLALALIAAIAVIAVLSLSLRTARAVPQSAPAVPAVLRAFWTQFTTGPEPPRVIFSNALFIGRAETGMRLVDPSRDSKDLILDHYTGVGEVIGVHDLDMVFSALNHGIDVKRGRLFTLDDAKNNNLIFVGSPAENLTLRDVPGSQEFVFRRVTSGPHKGELGIANVHPAPGEPEIFYPSSSSQPLKEDYAIIALVHGLNPERRMLILAGTTTLGTQAAVEYVCGKETMTDLFNKLSVKPPNSPQPFEALLRVRVAQGVPVGTELVAVRRDR